jgi:hypothetical protein
LCWGKVIVFYSVTGSKELNVFKPFDLLKRFILYVIRERGRKTINIDFNSIPAFGLNKYLMLRLIAKSINFIFYRRTKLIDLAISLSIKYLLSPKAGILLKSMLMVFLPLSLMTYNIKRLSRSKGLKTLSSLDPVTL